jgi:hypothetical protein
MKAKRGDIEGGKCTAPYCRKDIKPGDGNQWRDPEGETQRYCWKCWQKFMTILDDEIFNRK